MNELAVTEYKEIRVLTTQQIADAYGTDTQIVTNNFNRNKDRYVEGKHYICLTGDEKADFINKNQNDFSSFTRAKAIYLWTEKGAFLHAKSLNTDKAWEVYDHLVDTYFNRKKPITTAEQIKLIAQGNMELGERVDKVEDKLSNLENDTPLYGCEIDEVQKHVRKKGVEVLGGKDSEAYRDGSVRSQVYSDIYNQLKREYGCVSSYKSIKRKYVDDVHVFIDRYEPPTALSEQIRDCNAQVRIA